MLSLIHLFMKRKWYLVYLDKQCHIHLKPHDGVVPDHALYKQGKQ